MAPGKWLPLLLVFGNLSFPQTLQEQVQRVLESSPASRFDATPEAWRIRAEIGTASHVSALAGYVEFRNPHHH